MRHIKRISFFCVAIITFITFIIPVNAKFFDYTVNYRDILDKIIDYGIFVDGKLDVKGKVNSTVAASEYFCETDTYCLSDEYSTNPNVYLYLPQVKSSTLENRLQFENFNTDSDVIIYNPTDGFDVDSSTNSYKVVPNNQPFSFSEEMSRIKDLSRSFKFFFRRINNERTSNNSI